MPTQRNERLYEQIYEKYPLLFQKRKQPLDGWYKNCTDAVWTPGIGPMEGWLPLIDKLCEDITRNMKRLPEKDWIRFEIAQIKEKMGGLRFYLHMDLKEANLDVKDASMAIGAYIRKTEEESYRICEICGKPGFIRAGNWIKSLCEDHAEGRPRWTPPEE